MAQRDSTGPDTQHVIFCSDSRPLRFTGRLLGAHTVLDEENGESDIRVRLFRTTAGSLVWAWDQVEHGYLPDEPELDNVQQSHGVVISAGDGADPSAAVAAAAWERRPDGNAELARASVRVWHDAARVDRAIAAALYRDVE